MSAVSPHVIEVAEADFVSQVIEQSRHRPVLVDFWAPWCGPCRMLSPVLEKLAAEFNGAFVLAKINTDENPALAAQFDVRSIPTVMLVRDGQIAAEFAGAQPENVIRQWLQQQIAATPQSDDRLEHARKLLAAGELDEADKLLAALLNDEPDNAEATRLQGEIHFKRLASTSAPAAEGLDADYQRGCALAAAGKFPEALDVFLKMADADKTWNDGAARKAMLKVFDIIGPRSPLAEEYRAKLAKVLFR